MVLLWVESMVEMKVYQSVVWLAYRLVEQLVALKVVQMAVPLGV